MHSEEIHSRQGDVRNKGHAWRGAHAIRKRTGTPGHAGACIRGAAKLIPTFGVYF